VVLGFLLGCKRVFVARRYIGGGRKLVKKQAMVRGYGNRAL